MTTYVILRHDDTGSWTEAGQAEATAPARAIRALNVGEGTYIAVPLRSWKPLTVKVEQTTKVTIG